MYKRQIQGYRIIGTVIRPGTISAINAETRMVTVRGDGGGVAEINAGPDVKNFGQLKAGDRVTMELTRALALELRKSSTAEISRQDEADKVGAQAGEAPGGAIGTRTKIMAEVTAVTPESKTVTLKGPNRSIDLAVEDPPLEDVMRKLFKAKGPTAAPRA